MFFFLANFVFRYTFALCVSPYTFSLCSCCVRACVRACACVCVCDVMSCHGALLLSSQLSVDVMLHEVPA